jgi:outer membrane receptor protein involved in Fe transport
VIGHARFATELGANGGLQVSTWLLWSDWNLFLNQPESIDDPVVQVGEIDHRTGAGAQAEYTRMLTSGELTFGLSGRADGARYRIGETAERERVATRESILARYQEAAVYARWRPQLGNRLGLDLGARADVIRHQAFDRTDPASDWESAAASVLSPKLGAQYRLSERTALRASLSRGFRSAVGVIGDPGRPPISAWASDVGVRYATSALDLQAAFFRMDVDRERRLDPVTLEISSEGSSVRQGIDARASWRPTDRLQLRGSFTYNHARLNGIPADAHDDHNQGSSVVPAASVLVYAALMHPTTDEGKNVPGVAEYFGSAGADLTLGRLRWSADWRVFGPYIPIGEPDVKTQTYSLLDLALSIPLSSRTAFDLSLQNAFDIRYPSRAPRLRLHQPRCAAYAARRVTD